RTAVSLARTGGGEVVVAHVTRAPVVVVENGRVTPGSAAGEPLNLWNRFRALVPDDPGVHVTHEVVVAARVSAAGIVETLEEFGCDLIAIGVARARAAAAALPREPDGRGRPHRPLPGARREGPDRAAGGTGEVRDRSIRPDRVNGGDRQ